MPALVRNSLHGETEITGSNAQKQKRTVKIKPSAFYWSGLRTRGIVRRDKLLLPQACALTVQRAKQQQLPERIQSVYSLLEESVF